MRVNQARVKGKRRKPRRTPSGAGQALSGRGRRNKARLKQRKRSFPHYVRGVPRRPGRRVEKALRTVYGLGRVQAKAVCEACGRRPRVSVGNLETSQVQLIEAWRRENLVCGADRRRVEVEAIQRHLKLGTVRGMNLRRGLPVRGQRTSTNGMTARRLNKQRGSKVRN